MVVYDTLSMTEVQLGQGLHIYLQLLTRVRAKRRRVSTDHRQDFQEGARR